MMDFDNVLSIATQNRGGSHAQKRYSLQAGPPKKDPKSKGVNPAAIQNLLKKQQIDHKKKAIERKKQKEELLAKRVELKSDRKARAMASRTKDNFKGYNGIPIVEGPKKRRTKQEMLEEARRINSQQFRNNVTEPEDDEDNYEYEQTDSESDQEPQKPQRETFNSGSVKSSAKQNAPPKSSLNFADLLKLAEKKQHEPVELKPKAVKKEERLRTAEEIRELELERKARKLDKDVKVERSYSSASSSKPTQEKNVKPQKPKMPRRTDEQKCKGDGAFSSSGNDRDKPRLLHKDRDQPRVKPSSSNATNSKVPPRPTHSQASTKPMGTKHSSNHNAASSREKDNSQGRSSGIPGNRPSSSTQTHQKNHVLKRGEPQRQGTNGPAKSNVAKPGINSSSKPAQSQSRPGGQPQIKSGVRPGVSGVRPQGVGQSRPSNGGPVPGRAVGSTKGGPGTPKCTVVSETISSKNMDGSRGVPSRPGLSQRPGMQPRPGAPQRPGMQQRPGAPQRPGMQQRPGASQKPGMQQRPGAPQRPGMQPRPEGPQRPGMQPRPGMPQRPMNRPPAPMLPPITSAYKRKFEDEEEYDSEMDDFIDDGDDDPDEISKHIKEIFGYDRTKYKEESDYALKFMESSWKDMQKEEARSLKMAVQEDLEEERKEEEEMKRKNAKRQKRQ